MYQPHALFIISTEHTKDHKTNNKTQRKIPKELKMKQYFPRTELSVKAA